MEKVRRGIKILFKSMKKNKAEIAAILVCLAMLGLFVSLKEGFHMDELISFEMANAEYNPWIVPTQPEGRLAKFVHNEIDGDSLGETLSNLAAEIKDVLQNGGDSKLLTYKADVYEEPVWITAEQFRDYITVGKGDAFHYLSVYFNVKDDNHPPLHFMALHTISSIFRGRAEAWMGCVINLIAVLVVMILLIRIGRLLAEEFHMAEAARATGVFCALCYGLSGGAVATVLLIRMYGMLTMWCVAYFYIVLKKWKDRQFDRHNFGLILITVFGFWTQYFFLFYCILLAVVTGILLLRNKRGREFRRYVRSMAIAAVVGIAVFPFSIQDVLSSGRGTEALGSLRKGFAGYGEQLGDFLGILYHRTFGFCFLILLFALAVWLFRVRSRFSAKGAEGKKEAAEGGKQSLPEQGAITGERACGREEEDRKRQAALLWMLLLPPVAYFLLAAKMSPFRVDRYLMPVFPFVMLTGVLLMAYLLHELKSYIRPERGKLLTVLACGAAVLIQVEWLAEYDESYLYRGYGYQEACAREYSGDACVCVYAGVGYYENLKEFTYYRETLLVTEDELAQRLDKDSVREQEELILIVKTGVDLERVLRVMEEDYGFVIRSNAFRGLGPHGDYVVVMGKDK